jgi:FkbM family methyltransferase
VGDKYVIDIGAGCGETAIYFILRGAKHVIAIEPCPDVFNELLENLRLNNVSDKVSPINKAIASVHDRINIECLSGNFVVDTVSLRDVMKNIDLDDAVLKMDCEGCEYDVILNEYEYVRHLMSYISNITLL